MHEEVSQTFFFSLTYLLVSISWLMESSELEELHTGFPTTMPLRDCYEKHSTGRQAIQ
jgi:hypothetical protein